MAKKKKNQVETKRLWARFILELREEVLSLTQAELGREVGTTTESISNWENERNAPRLLYRRKLKELAIEKGFSEDKWPTSDKAVL